MNGTELINEAIRLYNPVCALGLFSGGHDSLTACHVASKHPLFKACAHVNTGIGIERTREFVRETCKQYKWKLQEKTALECGQSWEEFVRKHGFPGPAQHYRMYIALKERALRQIVRENKKRGERIMLISGCRSQESVRRMGTVEPIQKHGSWIWVAVIHDWSKDDCNDYMAKNSLPRNPVVDAIHKSGECLCGAFAKKGELEELAFFFPKTAEYIRELEKEIKQKFPWGWEDGPPKWWVQEQKDKKIGQMSLLCWSCDKSERGGASE